MDKCNLNLKKYIGTKIVEARPMNEIDAESIGYARKIVITMSGEMAIM